MFFILSVFLVVSFLFLVLEFFEVSDRVNSQLSRVPFLWLVGERGVEKVSGRFALESAQEVGLDLIEVGEREGLPVCKVGDLGKLKYEASKKTRVSKGPRLKEVRLTPKIGDSDFLVKLGQAKRFLEGGDKVQVSVLFRGRELAHVEEGQRLLDRFVVGSGGFVESRSSGVQGKRLVLVLVGKK